MIKCSIPYNKTVFPNGEVFISLMSFERECEVTFEFNPKTINEDIIELMILSHTLKFHAVEIEQLIIDYLPYSRQDRVTESLGCFSLKWFCGVVNSIEAKMVMVNDPHSDVAPALINNCNINYQQGIFRRSFIGKKDFYLICPDGGALKKIYKLAKLVDCVDVVECSKKRNLKTGEITDAKVHFEDFNGKDCYIVDDICDGGRTFIEISKILKQKNCGKVILMVTHGFFTKGLKVFDGIIDEVHTSKGRVK